jgi:glycopeptide antibiotics resistance protein
MNTSTLRHQPDYSAWSNRIVLLALLGIGYLTLFPFEFHKIAFRAINGNPFLLGNSGKDSSARDFFLNVLLFVPFGFGVSAQVRKRHGGLLKSCVWALVLGAFVSYSVEFMQLYIPERDSGWNDVFSNTLGSVVGFFLFALLGGPLLEALSRCENWIASWLSVRHAAAALLMYFLLAFAVSAFLQSQTRLSNWDPRCALFVGNDASGHAPWAGQVFLLQIWNRALPERTIQQLRAREAAVDVDTGLLALYDFKGPGPFQDRKNSLSALGWTAAQPQIADSGAPRLGQQSWLSTAVPAENLNREVQKTSQFTVRVVCEPAASDSGFGRIVSLSRSAENVNFHFRQAGTHLVFYFRNPLSETRSILAWDLPGVFTARKPLDIAAVYDGADAIVYVDGKPVSRKYRLGPGASLFHAVRFVRTPQLEGCIVVYLTILFLPAGIIVGLTLKDWSRQPASVLYLLIFGWILPTVLLEVLLSVQSGRRIWASNIALSLAFELAGILLINADGPWGRATVNHAAKMNHSAVANEA